MKNFSIADLGQRDVIQDMQGQYKDLLTPMRDYHFASWQYEKITEEIKEFQSKLDDDSEIGIQLASFGKNIVMNVIDLGFQNPDLMYFYGFVDKNKCQLIQHVSQLNFLLMSVPKIDPNAPPRRIGFAPPSEDEDHQ